MALPAIVNARLVTTGGVWEGASVAIEDGRIAGLYRRKGGAKGALDAAGRYVVPGLVDLHSDAIETQLAPRPEAEIPHEMALLGMDRLFASSGVTTGFHALVFMEGARRRSVAKAGRLYELITGNQHEGQVRHELHLRCEVPQEGSVRAVEGLLSMRAAGIVSLMDHTPNQGKFRGREWFKTWYLRDHPDADEAEVTAAFERAVEEPVGAQVGLDRIDRMAEIAKDSGAVLCSHDDATPEEVELLAQHGLEVSEFPINVETARRARELGVEVWMGAPNVVRGRSTGGSVSALEAVRLGLVDALVSDYHPPSMLQAAFKLAKRGILPLHEAVGLVSSGPARGVGLPDRGEIREGALADLVLVGERFGLPVVTHTIVGGRVVSASDPEAGTPRTALADAS